MNTEETELGLVEKHVNQLAEHFDTVQIFTTRHDAGVEDGTVTVNMGAGNWYARFGQVMEWVVKSDERARAVIRDESD